MCAECTASVRFDHCGCSMWSLWLGAGCCHCSCVDWYSPSSSYYCHWWLQCNNVCLCLVCWQRTGQQQHQTSQQVVALQSAVAPQPVSSLLSTHHHNDTIPYSRCVPPPATHPVKFRYKTPLTLCRWVPRPSHSLVSGWFQCCSVYHLK